jgi:uncharacterized surface protein with fasciclin (FAS1) repeats
MTAYHRIIPVLALAGCLAGTGAMGQTGGNAPERAGAPPGNRTPVRRTPANTPSGAQNNRNIVNIAASEGQFSTLAAALEQTDLVATLGNPGPFTVFAPDNRAFEALLPARSTT